MKTILLDKHQADIVERPEPELRSPEEVKVKLSYASIGGHDMMVFNGKMPPFYGKSLGMEASAVVTQVGKSVAGYRVGDHVSFELVNACGLCRMCKRGLQSFCFNARDTVGQMQEYTVRAVYPPASPYYVSAGNILPKLGLSDIITKIYPFERAAEAFRAKAAGGEAKVMLDFTEQRFKVE